jgi:hypothetical protein
VKYTQEIWQQKREGGILRYLMVDGIFYIGGPFALVMQIVGFFFLRDEGQTFGQYFSSSRMWVTFFAHAILFGGIMGLINWRRNQNAFAQSAKNN